MANIRDILERQVIFIDNRPEKDAFDIAGNPKGAIIQNVKSTDLAEFQKQFPRAIPGKLPWKP